MPETFERYEMKYLISKQQKEKVLAALKDYIVLDEYKRSQICNIYYDTPSKLLIRESIEHPHYKEKLRIRSYGVATEDSKVYIELKKKYDSVVYKRRLSIDYKSAREYFDADIPLKISGQITAELDYAKSFYKELKPSVYLAYEREAYYGKDDSTLRVTFDENIYWRDSDIDLASPVYGERIIPDDMSLMEIKIREKMPLFLAEVLSANNIFKTSFSKYGKAYMIIMEREKEKNENV